MPGASNPDSWEVALARLEGKIDTMVALSTAMQSTVTDLDRHRRTNKCRPLQLRDRLVRATKGVTMNGSQVLSQQEGQHV